MNWSDRTLMSELGFWFFPGKRWKYSRPRTFGQGANILAGRAGTTAGTVRQRRRPISWAVWEQIPLEDCMEERQHHLTESSSARLKISQKLEILPSPNSKSLGAYIFHEARRFQRPPCYCRILWDANILDVAHIFYICADILDKREYFR